MIKKEHVVKIKKFLSAGGEGINLAQRLLCAIAFRENLAPNFFNNPETGQILRGFRRYRFVRYLKKENIYELTAKGEKKLQLILIDEIIIKTPQSWDGKWRLVMYDLPIRFKKARDAFRWKLKDLGFYQFQKSAWIYPYPCEGELLLVADFFGVRKHIEILEISKTLNDKKLRAHFKL